MWVATLLFLSATCPGVGSETTKVIKNDAVPPLENTGAIDGRTPRTQSSLASSTPSLPPASDTSLTATATAAAGEAAAAAAAALTAAPKTVIAADKNDPWLHDMSNFPASYTFRNEVYNRPFRYRGPLKNLQDAYTLWFDCLRAERAKALEEGPMLTKEGQTYCHRLGHRINRVQRNRLNPVRAAAYPVDRIPVPSRDIFLDQYSTLSRPVILEKMSTSMIPTSTQEQAQEQAHEQAQEQAQEPAQEQAQSQSQQQSEQQSTIRSCLSDHSNLPSFSLREVCPDALMNGGYSIPTFAAEDALQTIRTVMSEAIGEAELNIPMWPTVWQTTHGTTAKQGFAVMPSLRLSQAPSGAHVLLAVLEGAVSVRLYAPHEARLHLTTSIDEFGQRTYHQRNNGHFRHNSSNHATKTLYELVTVHAPDALFVPSGFVYAWDTASDSSSDVIVVTQGFVDAGALNHLKDETELEWNRVDAMSALSESPLAAAASPPTPTSTPPVKETNADKMILKNYARTARLLSTMHGKNVPFSLSKSGNLDSTLTISWEEYNQQAQGTPQLPTGTGSTGGAIQKSKKNQYRAWRMEKIWEKKMLSMVPAPPKIIDVPYVGWESVRFKIAVPYGADSSFHSVHHGFVLVWSLMNNYTFMEDINATGSHEMTMKDHCWKDIKSSTNKEKVETLMLETIFVCECQVLQPDSYYALRLATKTSVAVGSSSPAYSVQTRSLSVPPTMEAPASCGMKVITYTDVEGNKRITPDICISVMAPHGDGGRPITTLLFRWKRAGEYHTHTHAPWRYMVSHDDVASVTGVSPTLQRHLHNVVPNATIVIQVTAETSIGMGAWSEDLVVNTTVVQHDSNVAVALHASSVAPAFVEVEEVDTKLLPLHVQVGRRLTSMDDIDLSSPLGILSMTTHKLDIVRHDGTSTVRVSTDGWRLHHAPTTHEVYAPLIIADPIDASEDFFYNNVQGHIVLIERGGGIPFRDKVRRAQLAGAVAVVLMDNTGKCTDEWYQGCVPGGSKQNGEGFAFQDKKTFWEGIDTPTLMITQKDARLIQQWIGSPLM